MAFGDPAASGLNTIRTSMLFNRMIQTRTVEVVRKNVATLYALMGKREIGAPPGISAYNKVQNITGNKVEIRLMGKAAAPAGLGIGIAAENAADAGVADDNIWANAEFTIAQYSHKQRIMRSELLRIKGSSAKTNNYVDEMMRHIDVGWQNVLGNAVVAAAVAPSDTAVGSIGYAIDAANTYGGIDRSVADNIDYRGVVNATAEIATLSIIRSAALQAEISGGHIKHVILGTALYEKLRSDVEAYVQTEYDAEMSAFGGRWFKVEGMIFIHDHRMPAGTIYGLDPNSWVIYVGQSGLFTSMDMIYDFSKKASYVLPTYADIQLICKAPSHNFKLTNKTTS